MTSKKPKRGRTDDRPPASPQDGRGPGQSEEVEALRKRVAELHDEIRQIDALVLDRRAHQIQRVLLLGEVLEEAKARRLYRPDYQTFEAFVGGCPFSISSAHDYMKFHRQKEAVQRLQADHPEASYSRLLFLLDQREDEAARAGQERAPGGEGARRRPGAEARHRNEKEGPPRREPAAEQRPATPPGVWCLVAEYSVPAVPGFDPAAAASLLQAGTWEYRGSGGEGGIVNTASGEVVAPGARVAYRAVGPSPVAPTSTAGDVEAAE
jgi:hypothetical protein